MSERRVLFPALLLALTVAAAPVSAQEWRTISQSRQAGTESALAVDIEYAAGELTLGPAAAGSLYRMTMRYDEDVFSPRAEYRDGTLRVGMNDAEVKGRNLKGGRLDLKLSRELPVDLELKFGAADASLDLGGINVRRAKLATGASRTRLDVSSPNATVCDRLELEVGAARFEATGLGNLNARRISVKGGVGEVILDFTGEWSQDLSGTIEMGLGTLTLRVPHGLGVRIRKGGMLSTFDSQGLMKRGDVYTSEDWDSSTHKLSLDVDAALGSINVVWVDLNNGGGQ